MPQRPRRSSLYQPSRWGADSQGPAPALTVCERSRAEYLRSSRPCGSRITWGEREYSVRSPVTFVAGPPDPWLPRSRLCPSLQLRQFVHVGFQELSASPRAARKGKLAFDYYLTPHSRTIKACGVVHTAGKSDLSLGHPTALRNIARMGRRPGSACAAHGACRCVARPVGRNRARFQYENSFPRRACSRPPLSLRERSPALCPLPFCSA